MNTKLGSEDGFALIATMLVALVMTILLVGAMATANHAEDASARSRNWNSALAVAEAGIQDGIARLQASGATFTGDFDGTTPQGLYAGTVSRSGQTLMVEARGQVGNQNRLGRARKVRVTLEPPLLHPYALFSFTSLELKNGDQVSGDVWANDSVTIEQNNTITGSVTAARSWVDLAGGSTVTGDVWSGGSSSLEYPWGIRMGSNARIGRDAKASVTGPSGSSSCDGADSADYDIATGNGTSIGGDATTWGQVSGAVNVEGATSQNTCTAAAVAKPLPTFTYDPANYDDPQEFASVADFDTWLATNKTDLKGTFHVHDAAPAQTNRINLTGAVVTGDVTIVTNAPVFTNGITDSGTHSRTFVVVSRYQPPSGSACDVNEETSECAIHVKNNFGLDGSGECYTATLLHAARGAVAVKNNQKMCGSIEGDSILVKNNQTLHYDARIARIVGFGERTYEVSRWEELPPS